VEPAGHPSKSAIVSDVSTRRLQLTKRKHCDDWYSDRPHVQWRWNEFEKNFLVMPLYFFGSESTISRFGKLFRDGQYSLVSFLSVAILLRVPPCPVIGTSGGRGQCPMESAPLRMCVFVLCQMSVVLETSSFRCLRAMQCDAMQQCQQLQLFADGLWIGG